MNAAPRVPRITVHIEHIGPARLTVSWLPDTREYEYRLVSAALEYAERFDQDTPAQRYAFVSQHRGSVCVDTKQEGMPPPPAGWSNTDWTKHLESRKGFSHHPLAGLHTSQNSIDAAADAYEAEYDAARRREPQ